MKRSLITGSLITVLVALVCISLAGIGVAQDIQTARPMFERLPPHSYLQANPAAPPVTPLTQWTYTFKYNNVTYNDVFVGTNPATTNTTTTIHWGIIPIKFVFGASNGNKTFDPTLANEFGTLSADQMIIGSPQFASTVDFVQGGTNVGKTQYGDAYQRANFWTDVMTNTNYHLLFAKAVIAPVQTINVSASEGSVIPNPWGGYPTGTMDINSFDAQLQVIMSKFKQIQPNTFPIAVGYNMYLTEGGCCIGGYHSANAGPPNGQTYAYTSVMEQASVGVFSQDIGALSHEVGEWIIDPFTTNNSPCGIMEIGDPLETEPNFGDYPYTVGSLTYHPQDLVFNDYFHATPITQVNGWFTFQNETNANTPCSRGSN
ncbi:conserved exported hypothetical protein [Candidatus Sulfotelmatobacter sp. SbA7]|jgi:hypothetical protein|nr:conserved exported hypothetical protein [Candidatus Sulfotelmatobacter sp. SbA7]